SGDGAALALYGTTEDDAADYQVQIGAGARLSARSGLAIYGESGDDVVFNSGSVFGNLFLGEGDNAFLNDAAGFFAPGDSVGLGANGEFLNAGVLSPFGDGTIGRTLFLGDLVLGPDGYL